MATGRGSHSIQESYLRLSSCEKSRGGGREDPLLMVGEVIS